MGSCINLSVPVAASAVPDTAAAVPLAAAAVPLAASAVPDAAAAAVPLAAAWGDTIPFVPPISAGLVIKVYDGDTITVAARLPIASCPLYRFAVRLRGIDSAEIRGKSEAERKAALAARDALSALVLGKPVRLSALDTEKYGRLLAHVHVDGVDGSLSDWMLAQGHAVPYDGGQKAEFATRV